MTDLLTNGFVRNDAGALVVHLDGAGGGGGTDTTLRGAPIPTYGAGDAGKGLLWDGTTWQKPDLATQAELDAEALARASADGLLISKALVDAKGDILTATADDVPARLGVGSNGQVLTADSTAGTGLKWSAASGASDFKQSALVASTANLALPPGGTALSVDGVALANGDRVLLKDQTAPAENGIYVVAGIGSSVTLARSSDANVASLLNDTTLVTIQQGAAAADTAWELITDNPIVPGTTPLYFSRAWPSYMENGIRNPWAPAGAVMQNVARDRWNTTITLATAATWMFAGLGVLPAGRAVNNVAVYWGTAGTHTIRHFAIVRRSDLVVLAVTANTLTATGSAINVIPLTAAYTSPVDVPVYLVLAIASSVAGAIGVTTAMQNAAIAGVAPIVAFNATGTPPTATPPAVGTTVPSAGATNQNNVIGYYLT